MALHHTMSQTSLQRHVGRAQVGLQLKLCRITRDFVVVDDLKKLLARSLKPSPPGLRASRVEHLRPRDSPSKAPIHPVLQPIQQQRPTHSYLPKRGGCKSQ